MIESPENGGNCYISNTMWPLRGPECLIEILGYSFSPGTSGVLSDNTNDSWKPHL
jgi:hypothetical protein